MPGYYIVGYLLFLYKIKVEIRKKYTSKLTQYIFYLPPSFNKDFRTAVFEISERQNFFKYMK